MSRFLSIALLSLYLALFAAAIPATGEQTPLAPSDPHTSGGWEWKDCGEATDLVDLKSITIKPDPPQPGQNLTVTASGYVSKTIQTGATADVVVKLGYIKLLTKSFDICDEAEKANATVQCPVEPGDYEVIQTVALPKEIPPAKFNVNVNGYNPDEEKLMCVDITIDFMSGLSSGLFGR